MLPAASHTLREHQAAQGQSQQRGTRRLRQLEPPSGLFQTKRDACGFRIREQEGAGPGQTEPGSPPLLMGSGPLALFQVAEDMATDHSCHMLTAQIHGKERPPLSPVPAEKMPRQASDRPSQVMGSPLARGVGAWLARPPREGEGHSPPRSGGRVQADRTTDGPTWARPAQITAQPQGGESGWQREQAVGVCACLLPRAAPRSRPPS